VSETRKIPTGKEDYDRFVRSLCTEELGISVETLLDIVPRLHSITKILNSTNLYVDRFAGMLRSTTKKVPFDCTYVKKCAILFMEKSEEYEKLKADILYVSDAVRDPD